jgi:hypothetical protein
MMIVRINLYAASELPTAIGCGRIVHEGLRKNKPVAAPLVGRDSSGIPHQGPGAGPGGRAAEFTSPRTIRFRFRPWAFLMKPK